MNKPGASPKRYVLIDCADCGKRVLAARYKTKRGYWGGASYCRGCANIRVKKSQGVVRTDVVLSCDCCGDEFHPTNKQLEIRRLRKQPPGLGRYRSFCPGCRVVGARTAYRRVMLCAAPVPGGCARNVRTAGLCATHYSRKLRGEPIDTAIRAMVPYDPSCGVSRERMRQRRLQARGLCLCGKPIWALSKACCEACLIRRRELTRARRGYTRRTAVLGSGGKPTVGATSRIETNRCEPT